MRDQILKSVRTLPAVLPMLALVQPVAAQARRDGSLEFSVGAGVMDIDGALASYLGRAGFTNNGAPPQRIVPTAVARLGYNMSDHFGLSFGVGVAGLAALDSQPPGPFTPVVGAGEVFLTPFADLTYTVNLNAGTSPFLTAGTQFTRVSGNGQVTHPTWSARAGLGFRYMMWDQVAFRVEGRMAFEHYAELPARNATYTPAVTAGFSFFSAGRHRPQ
jgi:hypothetical protein